MIIVIILILIILIYLGIVWLYKEYKKELEQRDKYISGCIKRINELENNQKVSDQVISWLYNELISEGILKDFEEIGDKDERRK